MGFVPCNMVSEVQVDDAELAEQLLQDSQDVYSSNSHLSGKYNITNIYCFSVTLKNKRRFFNLLFISIDENGKMQCYN